MKDHYAILGIPEDADDAAVHEAYRRRAQQYHPDKVRHLATEFHELAETRMRDINEAYDVLRDHGKRRAYDEQRRPKEAQPTAAEQSAEASPRTATTASSSGSGAFWIVVGVILAIGLLAAAGVRWVHWRRDAATAERAAAAASFQRARDACDNQRWQDAISLLQDVTRARPDWLEAWDLRWRAELALGLYHDAAMSLERAIELDPQAVNLRVQHARTRFMAGNLEQTRAELIWLQENGETGLVADLLARFQAQNPKRAERLRMPAAR